MLSRFKKIIQYINEHPLAGKHRLRAYVKLFHWQILQFLLPRKRIVNFVKPSRLLVGKGMTGATGNIYTGLHEFNDMGFLLHFLREGDLFFDIGANVGSYTMLAAGVARSRVVSFEPVPAAFHSLEENIKLNQIESLVTTCNLGAGSSNGVIKFTSSHDTVNHVVSDNETASDIIEVRIVTVDEMVQLHGCPSLVKIDVEGFETEVIKGMVDTLKDDKLQAIIIELNGSGYRYGFDESLIHERLLQAGFSPYEYLPFSRDFKKLDSFGNTNTIYIRDAGMFSDRISSAVPFEVFKELI